MTPSDAASSGFLTSLSGSPRATLSSASAHKAELLKQGLVLAHELERKTVSQSVAHTASVPPTSESAMGNDLGLAPEAPALQDPQPQIAPPPQEAWAQVWLQRGFAKLKARNYKGARDNFRRALEKDPHCTEALNGLGVALCRLSQWKESIQIFRHAIQLRPQQASLYCNLGTTLYLAGYLQNAMAAFTQAAKLNPKEAEAFYGLGMTLLKLKQHHQAIAAFKKASAIDVRHAHSCYGLGYAYYQQQDWPGAIAALGKAKQRNPAYAKRYEGLLKHCLQG